MSVRSTSAFAAGVVVALVLGTGTAYAATGGTFLIGRSNKATTTTTLTNAKGTALSLSSKAGQPSLRVNRNTKVPNLNADLVDGVDSASLARVVRIGTSIATGTAFDFDGDGTADAVVAVAVCPAGSQVTGGGAFDDTTDGLAIYSGPADDDAWIVLSNASDLSADNASRLEAYARCWNPRANVTDTFSATSRKVSPSTRRLLVKAAEK